MPVKQRQIAARRRRRAESVKIVRHTGDRLGRMGDFAPGGREHRAVLRDVVQLVVPGDLRKPRQRAQNVERAKGAVDLLVVQHTGGVGRLYGRRFGKERVAFRVCER